jgi:DHA1 family bicyclomycin/chloramphenicol resistance-like MFS transporter
MTAPAVPAQPHFAMSRFEFVAMMAMLMALQALAIDAMLPALGEIARDLGVSDPNHRQLVVGVYLLAAGVFSLVPGTLADRFGRRPILLGGLAIYVVFALACAFAPGFNTLLTMRVLQAVGSSALAVVPSAIVRDRFAGDAMAKLNSTVAMMFMVVPVLAPTMGQAVLGVAGWPWIFAVLAIMGTIMAGWVGLRLPETLTADAPRSAGIGELVRNMGTALTNRESIGYVIGGALVMGGTFSFINSAEQLISEHFGMGDAFPLVFAACAATMIISNLTNSRIVERFGARRVSHTALIVYICVAALQVILALDPHQTIWQFLPVMAANMCLLGFLGANFGSIALQPFARIAGAAASVQAFLKMVLSALLGMMVGQLYDGTARPLAFALLGFALLSLACVLFSERGRLFRRVWPRGVPRPAL